MSIRAFTAAILIFGASAPVAAETVYIGRLTYGGLRSGVQYTTNWQRVPVDTSRTKALMIEVIGRFCDLVGDRLEYRRSIFGEAITAKRLDAGPWAVEGPVAELKLDFHSRNFNGVTCHLDFWALSERPAPGDGESSEGWRDDAVAAAEAFDAVVDDLRFALREADPAYAPALEPTRDLRDALRRLVSQVQAGAEADAFQDELLRDVRRTYRALQDTLAPIHAAEADAAVDSAWLDARDAYDDFRDAIDGIECDGSGSPANPDSP